MSVSIYENFARRLRLPSFGWRIWLFGIVGILLLGSCERNKPAERVAAPPAKKTGGQGGPPPVQVEVRPVISRHFQVNVMTTGVTLAYRKAEVAAGISGLVSAVYISDGTWVEANTPLLQIEDTVWKAQVAEQQAQINGYTAELHRLQNGYLHEEIAQKRFLLQEMAVEIKRMASEMKRKQELYANKNISPTEWDQAVWNHEAAQARHQKAQAELNLLTQGFRKELIEAAQAELDKANAQLLKANDDLAKTKVRAPFAGAILAKKIEVGEWVSPETVVATLLDLTKIKVEIYVAERYIRAARLGLKAQVQMDAFPEKSFEAEVIEITPGSAGLARNFALRLVMDNSDRTLYPGLSCRVNGVLRDVADATMIHGDAIVRKERQTLVIRVTPENHAEFVTVTLGERDGDWFEVLDSQGKLQAGDKVVVTNNPQVYPQANLMVVKEVTQ